VVIAAWGFDSYVIPNLLFVGVLVCLVGCKKPDGGVSAGHEKAGVYRVEIPLTYPARLVAEIEEFNEDLHTEEKVMGNWGGSEGIRKQYRSLVYEDGKGSSCSLDISRMGNPDGYGDAFGYRRDSKNPQTVYIKTQIFIEGDNYYMAKWAIRGNSSERLLLTDDPKLKADEEKVFWNFAEKRKPITLRTEFLSDESFYPLRFMPGQVFTNMIRVKLDIPPDSLAVKYRFDIRTPKNVKRDDDGEATGKIRLRANLATADHSSRSIYDHVIPISPDWITVTGSFELSQDLVRELYIEPYGIFGSPEYRNLQFTLSK
jgi:hypothetical protein